MNSINGCFPCCFEAAIIPSVIEKSMLSENRKYDFVGELTLHRSKLLSEQSLPGEDKVNWLFLKKGENQYSFIYKIDTPDEAKYGVPFKVQLSFTMYETVKENIEINKEYEVLRGQEPIGILIVTHIID